MVLRQGVVVLGLVLAAGCGGSDDSEQDGRFTRDNITRRVTDALVQQGSMHLDMTIEAGDDKIHMSADQILGKDAQSTAMSMEYSESGEDDMSMRLVDGIVFANLGESSDGKFVRIDPEDAESQMGRVFAPLMDELDITTSIRQFEEAVTDVEQDGDTREIDGVTTTPFQVTIDVDRAIESGALEKDTNLRPGASVEYTFYVDDDDLLRRMEFAVDSAHATMDVTNLGEPVDIAAPPADEVIDEDAFMDAA
ncbi:hypothetical protein ASE12_08545 [Aeromicrobium sp. Root236]|uniref:hypothetical protein n=1 Tax=Aeromicrobium sp. Root236 TaxID=1736498 RepID=UPI0006FF21DD|nr:hypothetical protein [Aeromicrobium sp. Root236]KRC64817.1 hypothetical protein ASE12_08545 [Aeromicrobium sp. Root236]